MYESVGDGVTLGPPERFRPENNTSAIGLLTCNAVGMMGAFNPPSSNQTIFGNNGGDDGYTAVPTLDRAAGAFTRTYAKTQDVGKSIDAAQNVITSSPYHFPNGDSNNPGNRPYTDRGDRIVRRAN
jgi:hypothetical protein